MSTTHRLPLEAVINRCLPLPPLPAGFSIALRTRRNYRVGHTRLIGTVYNPHIHQRYTTESQSCYRWDGSRSLCFDLYRPAASNTLPTFLSTKLRTFATELRPPDESEYQEDTTYTNHEPVVLRPLNETDESAELANRINNDTSIPAQREKSRRHSLSELELVQLRVLHERDTIEEHYDRVAMRTELSKFRWIQTLRRKLDKAAASRTTTTLSEINSSNPIQDSPHNSPNATTSMTPYFQLTQEFMERKSIPAHVKDAFWNLIVAPTTKNQKSVWSTTGGRKTDAAQAFRSTKKERRRRMPSLEVKRSDIEVLKAARDWAVQQPLFWSYKQKHQQFKAVTKRKREEDSEVQISWADYQVQRSQQLGQLHFREKTSDDRNKEAKEMAHFLRSHLPIKCYKKLLKVLDEISTKTPKAAHVISSSVNTRNEELFTDPSETPTLQSETILKKDKESEHGSSGGTVQIYSWVHAAVHGHIHLIASELADYFYLNIKTKNQPWLHTEGTTDIVESQGGENIDVIALDDRVSGFQDAWETSRGEFVDAFQAIQNRLVEEHQIAQSSIEGSPGGLDSGNDINTDDPDMFLEREQNYDESEESVMATFQEVGKSLATKKAKKAASTKPRTYYVFEAIPVGSWGKSNVSGLHHDQLLDLPEVPMRGTLLEGASFPSTAPMERLIFVDNLPIDISENRIMDAYSRCGPIEDIKIFHTRPDLDPGRKSQDSKKKIRKPSSSSRKKWQRPRTPLYAMILYKDTMGAAKATVDPLRIFGMVLDKHLIRSYRAEDMTKLYVEDIESEQDEISIEYSLSQILQPDLYVSLDGGRRKGRVRRSSNCEVKFPNFETAYWAYLKLSAEMDVLKKEDGGSALHWMKTPNDAMLYWTRQLNF